MDCYVFDLRQIWWLFFSAASTVVSTTSVIGTTVFTVNATDAEGDQIYMSMVCDPTPCPFEIFDCKFTTELVSCCLADWRTPV